MASLLNSNTRELNPNQPRRNVRAWHCWCHALLTPAERWLQYDVARPSPLQCLLWYNCAAVPFTVQRCLLQYNIARLSPLRNDNVSFSTMSRGTVPFTIQQCLLWYNVARLPPNTIQLLKHCLLEYVFVHVSVFNVHIYTSITNTMMYGCPL